MSKSNIRILICLLVTSFILTLFLPRTAKFAYDYKKGKEWNNETLYAQFDFPIMKTDEQLTADLSNSNRAVIPYYRYSEDVVNKSIRDAEGLDLGSRKSTIIKAMRSVLEKGVVSDDGVKQSSKSNPSETLIIQKDKRATKRPVTEVYKLSDACAKILAEVSSADPHFDFDSLFRAAGVYDLVVPNLIYDSQTTELVAAESDSQVSPTSGYVNAGQLIVSEGEIVTSEIEQMLDSYKKEFEANLGYSGPKILFWLGNLVLSIMIVLLLFLVLYFTNDRIFEDSSRLMYILMIFLLAAIVPLIVARIREDLLYMVPFTVFALYLQAFFKNKVIIPVYLVSLMPLLIFTHNGVILFVLFSIAGVVAIYAFQYLGRGWKQFIVALISFAVLTITYAGFHMLDIATANIFRIFAYLFVASMLAVLAYPLVYLFEKLFNLVSSSRLYELCDTSNPLIRQLEQKAPGTFQHCLQVMNMADAVARSVGANPLLVRAGALYHDIGKMANPMCFVENESVSRGEVGSYHSALSPEESAMQIIKHVSDGIDIAIRNNLPEVVVNFIRTHHGTTLVRYFYNQYVNAGGNEDNVQPFTYPGRTPETKEQVILMICDSVEAASRTLKEHTPEAYQSFVHNILIGKLDERQFENADISIRDIETVENEIVNYLVQMHHERISYANKVKNK